MYSMLQRDTIKESMQVCVFLMCCSCHFFFLEDIDKHTCLFHVLHMYRVL